MGKLQSPTAKPNQLARARRLEKKPISSLQLGENQGENK